MLSLVPSRSRNKRQMLGIFSASFRDSVSLLLLLVLLPPQHSPCAGQGLTAKIEWREIEGIVQVCPNPVYKTP